jgi:hypothetical protein
MADIENPNPIKTECIKLYRQIDETATISDSFTKWDELLMLIKATQSIESCEQYYKQYHSTTYSYYGIKNVSMLLCGDDKESVLYHAFCTVICIAPLLAAAILSLLLIKNSAIAITLFVVFIILFFVVMIASICITLFYGKTIINKSPIWSWSKLHSQKKIKADIKQTFQDISNIDHIISLLKK